MSAEPLPPSFIPENPVMSEAQLRQRLLDCHDSGSLRSNVVALERVFNNQHTHVEEFAKIIARDPSLTTRMLRMANSAYFGLSAKINTIEGAVLYLGLGNIRLLMSTTPVIEDLEVKAKDGTKVPWREFWLHALGCAFATREILNQFDLGLDNDDDHISGLLQNVGKIVMAQAFPAQLAQLSQTSYENESEYLAAERTLLGCDHAALGAFYLQTHTISKQVVEAVGFHHDPFKAPNLKQLTAATHLADVMVRMAGLTGALESRPVLTERQLLELPVISLLRPKKGPILTGKMRKITERISKLPDLCRVML